jgi:PAS domain S-box-containing protein
MILAAISHSLCREKRDVLPWHWLGLFALGVAIHQFFDIGITPFYDEKLFAPYCNIPTVLAFLCLFEFGRLGLARMQAKVPGRWVYLPLALLASLGGFAGPMGLHAGFRYAFCLPGGLLSAAALYKAARRNGPYITDRKQAEEALKESESRLRLAVTESPYPAIVHAEDGQVIMLSRSWMDMTGYSLEDIPTITAWISKAYRENRPHALSVIKDLYGISSRVSEGEFEVNTATGAKRIWDFSTSPLGKLPDGRRIVISMAVNVTERKRAEDVLRLKNEELLKLLKKTGKEKKD